MAFNEALLLVSARLILKEFKEYTTADAIRKILMSNGYIVEDTKTSTILKQSPLNLTSQDS